MDYRITEAKMLGKSILETTFYNGEVKELEIKNLEKYGAEYAVLSMESARVDSVEVRSGSKELKMTVSVGESAISLDIDGKLLFKEGKTVRKKETEDVNLILASKLIAMRNRIGMTQKDLEIKSGIHQADISRIERGLGNPSLDTIVRLAGAMDCHLDFEFVHETEPGEEREYHGVLEQALPSGRKQGEYTMRDVLNLPDNLHAELIDGVIYDAEAYDTGSKDLINSLCLMMYDFAHDKNIKCRVKCSDFGVCEADDPDCGIYVVPDLCVIFDTKRISAGDYMAGGPDFVCEAVSELTKERDLNVKKKLYEKLGVKEYWVLDPQERKLSIYRLEAGYSNPYAVYSGDETASVGIFNDELKINLKGLWRMTE